MKASRESLRRILGHNPLQEVSPENLASGTHRDPWYTPVQRSPEAELLRVVCGACAMAWPGPGSRLLLAYVAVCSSAQGTPRPEQARRMRRSYAKRFEAPPYTGTGPQEVRRGFTLSAVKRCYGRESSQGVNRGAGSWASANYWSVSARVRSSLVPHCPTISKYLRTIAAISASPRSDCSRVSAPGLSWSSGSEGAR